MKRRSSRIAVPGLAVVALLAGGLGAIAEGSALSKVASAAPSDAARAAMLATAPALGPRTRSSGCRVRGLLPDPGCTPGAIFLDATVKRICTPGYARSVRRVSVSLKRSVYEEYGIASHVPGSYEVDHLVPLELGGSNSIANLWPEVSPGYHQKDVIENRLHDAVCAGTVSLRTAQRQIAHDWRRTAVGAHPG